jgi:hypothetical protein
MYTVDRPDFLAAVGAYRSSAREAEELMAERLAQLAPAGQVGT